MFGRKLVMIPKNKLQVFVSSTYTDLMEERQAAVEAILDAGHIPAGMELFAAGDKSQMEVIQRWIDESDLFLLILGGRYGSIERESGRSYIELEYDYARSKEKPFFALAITENYLSKKTSAKTFEVIEMEHQTELKAFREKVGTKMVRFWDDLKDIKLAINKSLSEFSGREDLVGWIRGDQVVSNGAVEEFAKIATENTLLRDQLRVAENSSKRDSFKELERRVGEVISNERLSEFIPRFRLGTLSGDSRLTKSVLMPLTDDEFLRHVSEVLKPFNIPLGERIRRQALYKNLNYLCSSSAPDQARLFYGELQSQIHDESARMLIVKALAEQDKETLYIFGRFGISFNVLNEAQDLADELTRRISPAAVDESPLNS